MRNINFIRLQNFILFYAPNDKKKRYTLNKLHEVETEFEAQKKQISIYKKILEDVFDKHGELCALCEKKGQCLPECECMTTNEIIEYIKNNCDKKVVDYESCDLWLVISFEDEKGRTIFMKYKENRHGNCVRPFTPEEQKKYLVKRCNALNKFWGDKANGF